MNAPFAASSSCIQSCSAIISLLAVIAVRNARLIGHDHHPVAEVVQAPHAFLRTGNPLHLVGSMNISMVEVDDPIPIEKGCGPSPECEQFAPALLQCFWQADIEKITVANTSPEPPFPREDGKDICLDRAWQGMNRG